MFQRVFLTYCFIIIASQSYSQGVNLQVGVSELSITPKESYYHYRGQSTGVADSLYAKALIIHSNNTSAALVICDLLWIERELSIEVRKLAAQQTNIPFENIIIAGTHTHTGPAYHQNIRELTGELRPPFDSTDTKKDDYQRYLVKQIVRSIVAANANKKPAKLELVKGITDKLSYNRRFIMNSGKVVMNPGIHNPDVLRPEGPVDPDVGVVLFKELNESSPFASLTNFSVHADTYGGTEFSADYPGVLSQELKEEFGKDYISIFGAGACGNLNHVDVNSKDRKSSQEIGSSLASIVKELNTEKKSIINEKLYVSSEYAYVPLQSYSEKELTWATKEKGPTLYTENPSSGKSAFLERRRRLKIRSLERMRREEAVPPTVESEGWHLPLEVQVFAIGKELAIVGLPGEQFVEHALYIKQNSPFFHTQVIELTNSHIAYVPTKEAFKRGGYETINSMVAPGGGEMLADKAVRILNKLYNN